VGVAGDGEEEIGGSGHARCRDSIVALFGSISWVRLYGTPVFIGVLGFELFDGRLKALSFGEGGGGGGPVAGNGQRGGVGGAGGCRDERVPHGRRYTPEGAGSWGGGEGSG
jgi:hypothetical protein